MRNILQQLYYLLNARERISAYWCFLAMLIMALFEVVGVASIMPFMAVLSDPEIIYHHPKLLWLYQKSHLTNNHQFIILLGVVVLAVLVASNLVSMLTIWLMMRFNYDRQYELSEKLFRQYFYQSYAFFLQRNSSELSKNILTEVLIIINRAFIPAMQLIAKLIVIALILLLLLIVNPMLAFVLMIMLGGAYFIIYFKVRKKLFAISKLCLEASKNKYKIINEAFGGIKDIKLLGRENVFLEKFSYYAKSQADEEAVGNIIAQLPRYLLETLAFGGVLVIILYLLLTEKNISNALPILALYAFASLRLMPAMQQVFTSVAFMRMSREALSVISHDLHKLEYVDSNINIIKNPTLLFKSHIKLVDITYSYPKSDKVVIDGLNLVIPVNTTTGIVGMTGAGKSTIIDLILGLLTPTKGSIYIDDIILKDRTVRRWQNIIGYVPQMIYLADDTIANNIAFGLAPNNINHEAVKRAAKLANLDDFIENQLSLGYETIVGDRGVCLSGGQRQRIGIARALYHDPDVIVLDEATSSLDTLTEDVILDAIKTLSVKKTIIIIAHRLTTLIACDMIHVLKDGKMISSDKYEDLLKSCTQFREMARIYS